MAVTVKHKAGKFYPNLWAIIYVCWKLMFKKVATVSVQFDRPQDITEDLEEHDFLKICGWKSGIKTETNSESMLVYRSKHDTIEFGKYYRDGKNVQAFRSAWDYAYGDFSVSFKKEIQRRKGEWIPCFPWSGGTHPPKKDYSYKLKIK